MVYEYSWSGPQRAVSAEKVFNHLKSIEVNGEVSKQAFVDSARDEASEMHELFARSLYEIILPEAQGKSSDSTMFKE